MTSNHEIPDRFDGKCWRHLTYTFNSKDGLAKALMDHHWDAGIAACSLELSAPQAQVELWFYLAFCLFRKGAHDEADNVLDKALKREPGYLEALALKGRICLIKGNLDAALPVFELVTRLDGIYSWGWAGYSVALARAGNEVMANRAYLKAVETCTDTEPTRRVEVYVKEFGI